MPIEIIDLRQVISKYKHFKTLQYKHYMCMSSRLNRSRREATAECEIFYAVRIKYTCRYINQSGKRNAKTANERKHKILNNKRKISNTYERIQNQS